jgi:subtilisin family serine protease
MKKKLRFTNFKKKLLAAGIILPAFLSLLFFVNFLTSPMDVLIAFKPNFEFEKNKAFYALKNFKTVFEQSEELPFTVSAQTNRLGYFLLSHSKQVQYISQNRQLKQALITNDTYFTTDSSVEDKQWYLPKIRLPEAWEFSRGSADVTVAVVDTGIHASHIELNDGRVIGGYDTINNQSILTNTNSDDNGHGTAVAGVIGAIPNNGRGISGINWSVKIMPIKALKEDGTGDIATVSAGIVWAADHGANIINLSIGGQGFGMDQTLNNAIAYAYNKGALIVSAAGNDLSVNGINLDINPVFPICSDQGKNMVLGVAASDINDSKASFSNFSINCVDIVAPGKKILTTAYLPSDPSNNLLIYASGTSLATPVVSGVAALIKAAHPNYSSQEIVKIILSTADNIDQLNQINCLGSSCNGFLGRGRINAFKALVPQPIFNGSIVRDVYTSKKYFIDSNTKRPVSDFVYYQRFQNEIVIDDSSGQLVNYNLGSAYPPLDNTLLKSQFDPTVYTVIGGVRHPITYLVFVSRSFSFANVLTIDDNDLQLIELGDWYWPPDKTLVLKEGDPTVYVMDQNVRRPVTYYVFMQRKLSFTKIIKTSVQDFEHIPKPSDNYWLAPLDGTLVKSKIEPAIYVILNSQKHTLSYKAYTANYRGKQVKILPQAEIDVIAPGEPIF